ncbi:MAG TPA: GNAT family N-acetyltransferase [Myxococcales bacterium]|nr:GNAT family N-acetyltransferase [Myxococcales bacterium]
MGRVQIREASQRDLSIIVDFNQAMALETEALRLERHTLTLGVRALLRDRAKGFYLVAEREGRLVGQVMVTYEWSDWRNGDWWWLQSVYVAPDARRSGVFRALYAAVAARARRARARGLRLYVEKQNVRAQRTYVSLGMREARYRLFERGRE